VRLDVTSDEYTTYRDLRWVTLIMWIMFTAYLGSAVDNVLRFSWFFCKCMIWIMVYVSEVWLAASVREATLSWKSLKVLEDFCLFFSPWKQIWYLKVLEFSLRGPWMCLNFKMIIVWKMVQSSWNYKQYSALQYYLLIWWVTWKNVTFTYFNVGYI